MTIPPTLVAGLLTGALAAQGQADSWVSQALSWGASQKKVDLPSAKGAGHVRYTTPYLRVAMAALEAKRQGRTLDPAGVPDELTAPELHVLAWMLPVGTGSGPTGMAGATSVTLLVGGERLSPSSVAAEQREMSVGEVGGDRKRFEGRELKAVFRLNQPIPDAVDAIVEYTWVAEGKTTPISRTYKLDLRKVRW